MEVKKYPLGYKCTLIQCEKCKAFYESHKKHKCKVKNNKKN
jgi:hypothetical protein